MVDGKQLAIPVEALYLATIVCRGACGENEDSS